MRSVEKVLGKVIKYAYELLRMEGSHVLRLHPTNLDHVRCELSRPELKMEFVSIIPMLQFGISGSALVSIRADCSECFLIDAQWSRLVGFVISRVPRLVIHDMHI